MYVNSPFDNDFQPQFSTSVTQSLQEEHDTDIKKCKCKIYIGPVSQVKGLTIQVVHYLQIVVAHDQFKMTNDDPEHSRSRLTDTEELCIRRTWSEYAAISLSSCEFHLTNLLIEDEKMPVVLKQDNVLCLAWSSGGDLATGWGEGAHVWSPQSGPSIPASFNFYPDMSPHSPSLFLPSPQPGPSSPASSYFYPNMSPHSPSLSPSSPHSGPSSSASSNSYPDMTPHSPSLFPPSPQPGPSSLANSNSTWASTSPPDSPSTWDYNAASPRPEMET